MLSTPWLAAQVAAILSGLAIDTIMLRNAAYRQQVLQELKSYLLSSGISLNSGDLAEDDEQLISDLKQWCQQDGLLTPEAALVPLEPTAEATTTELTLYNMSEGQLLNHLIAKGATVDQVKKFANGDFEVIGYQVIKDGLKLNAHLQQPTATAPLQVTAQFQKSLNISLEHQEQKEQLQQRADTLCHFLSSTNDLSPSGTEVNWNNEIAEPRIIGMMFQCLLSTIRSKQIDLAGLNINGKELNMAVLEKAYDTLSTSTDALPFYNMLFSVPEEPPQQSEPTAFAPY
ncbi:hypothetical protein AVM71_12420 [Piscirickettsia salmonis]|nr:hypothetical protein AVM71_12420 [Piscirickettsia salmonis]